MRGAIPGREPHLFKKKRANKISSKRWKHIKTHNENAIRSMEIYQKKRKKLNDYGYYTKKMENLETATPLFDGNMIIIPSTTIPNLVKYDIKFLFANISTSCHNTIIIRIYVRWITNGEEEKKQRKWKKYPTTPHPSLLRDS